MKINEMFLGIQGEGIESGLPTFFIRTGGCNLRCSWCDTKYAYKGRYIKISEIIDNCQKSGIKKVCITGGEPLMQKEECIKLMEILINEGFEILLETNGTFDICNVPKEIIISIDIKCPSSRMSNRMLYENLRLIRKKDQVKFIIVNLEDYEFAKRKVKEHDLYNKTNIIFQPEYNSKFTKELIKKILKDKLNVRIGLQLHKVGWKDSWSKK